MVKTCDQKSYDLALAFLADEEWFQSFGKEQREHMTDMLAKGIQTEIEDFIASAREGAESALRRQPI